MGLVRILIIIGLFLLIYQVLKGFSPKRGGAKPSPPQASAGPKNADDLVQDPQCGAYFPRSEGVATMVEGRILYFCTESCRDKFLAQRQSK
jgi:YHS domain-containing protein